MSEALKIAFIGTGFIAGKHAGILKRRDDVEVVAAVDMVEGKAAQFLERNELPQARPYESLDTMLDNEDLDAVYVCVPPFGHHGEVERMASQGLHLFIEKPIAPDAAVAQSMVRVIEGAGIVSQVGFHMRFMKGVRQLRSLMKQGAVGPGLLFEGRYWTNFEGPPWWKDQSKSGGQVYEQVCHIYDLARYFLGEPREVTGRVGRLLHQDDPDYSVEDTSASMIEFAGGAMACVTGSNCALPDRFIGDFRVVCEGAVLDFRSAGDWRVKDTSVLTLHNGKAITEVLEILEDGDPFADETEDFIRAIREDTRPETPAREGLETIRLVERVRDGRS